MVVIVVVAVIATAGFALLLLAVLLVTIGIHQEERRVTFARRRAPTVASRIARRIVGRYVRPTAPEPATRAGSGASGTPHSRSAV